MSTSSVRLKAKKVWQLQSQHRKTTASTTNLRLFSQAITDYHK
jgi:hypothetical protein